MSNRALDLMREEIRAALMAMVDAIPVDPAVVVVRSEAVAKTYRALIECDRRVEGVRSAYLADVLDVSPATVRRHMRHLRKHGLALNCTNGLWRPIIPNPGKVVDRV